MKPTLRALKKSFAGTARGFSLVELMVVVAIIGVLASLAIPRFKTFQAKARQAEAKTNLAHLYTLEQAYHGNNDTYTNLKEGDECADNILGFKFENCKGGKTTKDKRYMYQVKDSSASVFTGLATSEKDNDNKVMPGCTKADQWSVNQEKVIKAETDVVNADCGKAK